MAQPKGVCVIIGDWTDWVIVCCCLCAKGQSRPIKAMVGHCFFLGKFVARLVNSGMAATVSGDGISCNTEGKKFRI